MIKLKPVMNWLLLL